MSTEMLELLSLDSINLFSEKNSIPILHLNLSIRDIDKATNLIHNIPNLYNKKIVTDSSYYMRSNDRELVNGPQVKESKIHRLKDFTRLQCY